MVAVYVQRTSNRMYPDPPYDPFQRAHFIFQIVSHNRRSCMNPIALELPMFHSMLITSPASVCLIVRVRVYRYTTRAFKGFGKGIGKYYFPRRERGLLRTH